MKSNFSFKFFACAVLFVFLSIFAGGCGGSGSYSPTQDVPVEEPDNPDELTFENGETLEFLFEFNGENYLLYTYDSELETEDSSESVEVAAKRGGFKFTKGYGYFVDVLKVNATVTVNGNTVIFNADNGSGTSVNIVIHYNKNTYTGNYTAEFVENGNKKQDASFEGFAVNEEPIDFDEEGTDNPIDNPEPTPTPEDPSDNGNNGSSDGTGGSNPTAPSTISVTSVTLNSSDISLGIGKTATLVATVLPTNATNATVTWSTTNPTVATVANGVVTGVSAGTATITATSGGKSATCTVNVGVVYLSRSYDTVTQQIVTETKVAVAYERVTANTSSWENGKWYVVSGEVSFDTRIIVSGEVNLILCDGATLSASKGINVASAHTINIYAQSNGTGSLSAKGLDNSAGIGGNDANDADSISGGIINIYGGSVTATGGASGAGIGSGNGGLVSGTLGGNITIYGGSVIATGGSYGAGIGGGNEGSGGNITINGGSVTATGGLWAAGIGGGNAGSGGTITIKNTVTQVTATKGSSAPNSIGAGDGGSGGSVTIDDPSKVTMN